MLHHKIAKPGERLRYSVVGADRENIGHRTYTVGTFSLARGDGVVTLSTGPSSTQKTLLLLHNVRENGRKIVISDKRLLHLRFQHEYINSSEMSREIPQSSIRCLSFAKDIW